MVISNKKIKELTIYAVLCQSVKVFLPKTLPSFFQMQEILKPCRKSNLRDLRCLSFGD